MKRSKRFAVLAQRPVNQDGLIGEWPEEGLIAMDSPFDPVSSVKVDNGLIVELDGKRRDQFDMIDRFIADYAINVERTEQAMRLEAVEIARMLVDIHVSREEIIAITTAITPAKAVEVMAQMNVVEMMMALQKMRARRTPSNQCHVTNLKDNPVQIAADAAEAGIRGFSEQETTVGIARYAPFNALALLVGSQCGRPGVLTQCSVEEATELELGMRGLTSYAETVSVYGTEAVFTDGDDTPWSKAFLASAYASRGLKMRYTSGTGSEALMGYSESKSMLYLESRCIFITKGAGVQAKRRGELYRHDRRCAVGHSGGAGGKPDRLYARPRSGVRQRPDFLPLGYSPHRAHPDADAAGHRLYFLRLQRGAELRQHVRRLELRCGRF